MAQKKRKGLFAKFIDGPERSEDYARSTLPTNRWSLGWDLIRNNFRKIVLLNLLMLLFLFPLFGLLIFRGLYVDSVAATKPFSQNIGFGYPAYPMLKGVAESVILQSDILFFIALLIFSFYIAIGLAGGFYVMRNMVWAEGVFLHSDFWSGVKKNYKTVLGSLLFYVAIMGLSKISIDYSNIIIASGTGIKWLFTLSKIISYIFMGLMTLIFLFMLTTGVTYELKFFKLLKNGLILAIALLPLSVFFVAFGVLPTLLILTQTGSIFFLIGVIVLLFFGLAYFTLVWTDYSHWLFDEFINDKVAGAKKNRGIYKKGKEDEEDVVFDKSTLATRKIKPVTDYDIEIAELPTAFTREDLKRLEESKQKMREDSDKYAEEHDEKPQTIDELMTGEDKKKKK